MLGHYGQFIITKMNDELDNRIIYGAMDAKRGFSSQEGCLGRGLEIRFWLALGLPTPTASSLS